VGSVLIATNVYGHPAVLQATDRAFGLWVTGLCWSSNNGRTGRIPKAVALDIAGHWHPPQSLVKAGLWIEDGDEYIIAKRASYSGVELWRYGPMDTYRKAIPQALRQAVYERDGYACLHCGTTESLTLDHIHPYSKGGEDTYENLQTLCRSCNSRKGAKIHATHQDDQA